MNVLSLFDGMSCGRIALNRAGITVTNYYSSELDKFAIQVTTANWPDAVQLGDVENWRDWDIDWSSINLLIGGSPCQGFSFAGKQLAFDDPRSRLFFVYVDILNHIKSVNPSVKFMMENVKMKQEFLNVISKHLQVQPILINSKLVSAQNRQRFYWCNWYITQPSDKSIKLPDILESKGFGVIKSKNELKERNSKSTCLDANYHKGVDNHGQRTMIVCGRVVGRRINNQGKRDDYNTSIKPVQRFEPRTDDKTGTLTTVQKDNMLMSHGDMRKLTPVECERLQTVPDNYTNHVSNTQRYKMLGNGWTVDVIAHIFKQMFNQEVTFI